ncbi:hypothetical protein MMC10_001510 [Thelotrema lepadinum]|nr:hypothetical protein [Thelotrema lepadinum]
MKYRFISPSTLLLSLAVGYSSPSYTNDEDLIIRDSGVGRGHESFPFAHSALHEDRAIPKIYARTKDEGHTNKIPTDLYFPPSKSVKSQDMPSLLRQSSTLTQASVKSNHELSRGHNWPLSELQGKPPFPKQESGQMSPQGSIKSVYRPPSSQKLPKTSEQSSSEESSEPQHDSKLQKVIAYCRSKMKGASSAANSKGTELAGADLTCGSLLSAVLMDRPNGGRKNKNNGDKNAKKVKDKKQRKSIWGGFSLDNWDPYLGG